MCADRFACEVYLRYCDVASQWDPPEPACDTLCDEILRSSLQWSLMYKIAAEIGRPRDLSVTLDRLQAAMATQASTGQLDLDDPSLVYDLLNAVKGSDGCGSGRNGAPCTVAALERVAAWIASRNGNARLAVLDTEDNCIDAFDEIAIHIEFFFDSQDAIARGTSRCSGFNPCQNGATCIDEVGAGQPYTCECPATHTGELCQNEVSASAACSASTRENCQVDASTPVEGRVFGLACGDPVGQAALTCHDQSYEGCYAFVDEDRNGYYNAGEEYARVGADNRYSITHEGTPYSYDIPVLLATPSSVGQTEPVATARGVCAQVLVTRANSNQMNALTTVATKLVTKF